MKFKLLNILFLLFTWTSCRERKPQEIFNYVFDEDRLKSAIIIHAEAQDFGDGSSWFHFTVDSNELKRYLKDFKVKGTDPFDGINFQYFWPDEAPKWWQPDNLGKNMKVYRQDEGGVTDFFLVNRQMTEVYCQHTMR